MTPSVHVRTPCRLHFGMFGFGHANRPQFGGVGAMIDPPSVEARITAASEFSVDGPLAGRARRFAEAALSYWHVPELPACEIRVASPPDHIGLGVGTQLGLAVAAAMRQFLELPDLAAPELAASIGRGLRSAIGTYGFERGGLIVDAGKREDEPLGTLACRATLPEDWRFVVVRPSESQGLAGDAEAGAFAKLPAVPDVVTRGLWRIVEEEMLPAVAGVDCQGFGDAVYRFGRVAGECFSAVQGGAFASSEVARVIDAIRDFGTPGVGQSSWGPTIFAVTPGEASAQTLSARLIECRLARRTEITIARPNNRGATIVLP